MRKSLTAVATAAVVFVLTVAPIAPATAGDVSGPTVELVRTEAFRTPDGRIVCVLLGDPYPNGHLADAGLMCATRSGLKVLYTDPRSLRVTRDRSYWIKHRAAPRAVAGDVAMVFAYNGVGYFDCTVRTSSVSCYDSWDKGFTLTSSGRLRQFPDRAPTLPPARDY